MDTKSKKIIFLLLLTTSFCSSLGRGGSGLGLGLFGGLTTGLVLGNAMQQKPQTTVIYQQTPERPSYGRSKWKEEEDQTQNLLDENTALKKEIAQLKKKQRE